MSDTELLLEPKSKPQPEPVRRLEVFTGTGRRRRWTADQKARIVCESNECGETVSAVARRHGLTPQQLFAWRRNARREQAVAGEGGTVFAPVIVEATVPSGHARLAPAHPASSTVIEIVIDAVTVRIPPPIDAATLKMVLSAVRATT